jgi:hypothetical protein
MLKIAKVSSLVVFFLASLMLVVLIAVTLTAGTQDSKVLGTADREGQRIELPANENSPQE